MRKNNKDLRGNEEGSFKNLFLLVLAMIILGGVALFGLDELTTVKFHWIPKGLLFFAVVFFVFTAGHEKKKVFQEKRLANKILYEKGLEPLKE